MERLNLHIFRSRPKKQVPVFPSAYCCDYLASEQSKKEYGDRITSFIQCITEEDSISIINSEDDYKRLGNLLVDKYFIIPGYLDDLIKWSEEKRNLLVDYIENNLGKSVIYKLDNIEIADRYIKYCELYRSYHLKNTPAWWVGAEALLVRVEKYFQENNIESIDQIIAQLIDVTEYEAENFKEELSILDIAGQLQAKGIARVSYEDLNNQSDIKIKFDRHIREFSAIPFGYNNGVIWDSKYFLKKINDILKDKDANRLMDDKLAELEGRKNNQIALLRSINLPDEIRAYFKKLRQLAYLQDLKKATQVKSHPILQLVVKKEIAERLSIPVDNIDYMGHFEIRDCLMQDKISAEFLAQIEERKRLSVFISEELNYKWLIGEEAKEFLELHGFMNDLDTDIKELKGYAASKGLARGIVRVYKQSTEINKFDEGDILVTAMTTPDFVPLIKKASAIITDEGGITCHAAIVSRELGIPCIIGTKIATKVLKDGDLVEVDADNRIIKIIK